MEKKLVVSLSSLIFFFLPWYYSYSGSPQPVDVFIFILFAVFFFLRFPTTLRYFYHSQIFKIFLVFSLYGIIVLLLNFIIEGNDISIFLTVQNIYIVMLVVLFLTMIAYLKDHYNFADFYKLILLLLLIDLVFPLGFLFKEGITLSKRLNLSFDNANQLGFFALVNMSVFFYISLIAHEKEIRIEKLKSLFIINVNLLLLFLSSSRACYTIIVLYVLSYLLIFKLKLRGFTLVLFWIMGSFISIFFISALALKLYQLMVETRTAAYVGFSDDFHFRAIRGITYNFNNIWNFLFGNGTYNSSERGRMEFHNNFLAIFNMLGLIGILIYIYMNLIIVKNLFKKGIFYFLPYFCYLFYSMFHYSYRTRMNWIFLALIIFILFDTNKHYFQKRNIQLNKEMI